MSEIEDGRNAGMNGGEATMSAAGSDGVAANEAHREVFLRDVSLDDKYDLEADQVFITGTQAVVRLVLTQAERDRRAGLSTAGYVSGYRGSPIGGLDMGMWKAKKRLEAANIVFEPGLNEDLAATALWGTQQAELFGEGKYDGVFGVWYGKGPGVDRSGDVFRHANLAGTSPNGGVIALMGDDHVAESSTTAHQSEFHFVDVMMPVMSPAGVQEIVDYGLFGYGLSRYAGVWVGIKCIKDTIESTAVIDGAVDRVKLVEPEMDERPAGGLSIRRGDHMLPQEARLHEQKRPAVLAYLKANRINRTILSGGSEPKLGIITAGKSYLDVRQALDDLGVDEVRAADLGVRLFKCGCVYPLPPEELRAFAEGLEMIVVVEEKRPLIEVQLKESLYGTDHQPVIVGKRDERGEWLFPIKASLDTNQIAVGIGERLARLSPDDDLARRVSHLRQQQERLSQTRTVAERMPYFCAGCPHSSSTHVPEGSRAYAGIGCHYMVQWMDRETEGFTQMGGEGANWVGERHFVNRDHVFQNLGDGTFNHSGALALRHAVTSGANITYKILFNDAVAMTGGQPNEGGLTPWKIAQIVAGEGARAVRVVTDEPEKYGRDTPWPQTPTGATTVHHRRDLQKVQRELREMEGVTVVVYDQTCASEKRRRRKRGMFPDPDRRIVINERVCEACGDCGVKSNCVAVGAVETETGRKRAIDQSACNKDYSCVEGFCPSFVTVHGGKLRQGPQGQDVAAPDVPAPRLPALDRNFGIIITGVGGTGVVTIGAVLGMAAHLEGRGVGIIDMAGLAQKGGAVASHLRLAPRPEDIASIRIAAGGADLILGCDMVTASGQKVLAAIDKGRTHVVVNAHEKLDGQFTHNVDFSFPTRRIVASITEAAGSDMTAVVEAERIATAIMGDAIATNMFMLGHAWQLGAVPLARESILHAIEMNGVAISMNQQAFEWGRVAAHDASLLPDTTREEANPLAHRHISKTLDEVIERRAAWLTDYQSARYARRYLDRVAKVRAAEAVAGQDAGQGAGLGAGQGVGLGGVTDVVARNLYKLMAIKDEFEVGRLFSDGEFEKQLELQFADYDNLEFHLAPPLFSRKNEKGELTKSRYGPWMRGAYAMLAKMRSLRGTPLNVFGYTAERRMERSLLAEYEAVVDEIAAGLSADNADAALALAAYPDTIRGFGHIKERNAVKGRAEKESRLAAFRDPVVEGMPVLEAAE